MRSLREFKEFIGNEVWRLFWMASGAGLLLFAVESSFVLVLQGFLHAVDLVPEDRLLLPDWYPRSVSGAMLMLVLFGFFRGVVVILKSYLASRTHQAFMRTQRNRILRFSMYRASETSVPEMVGLFTERVNQVGGAFNSFSQLILFITSSILLVGTALYLAPIELCIGLVSLAVLLYPLGALSRRITVSGKGLVKEWEIVSRSLIHGLRHHFFLKVYSLIDREVAVGERSLTDYSRHYNAYYFFASIKNSVPMIAGVLIVSVITVVSQEYIGTAPAKLISFFYIFIRIAQGGSEINAMLNDIRLQYPGYQVLRAFFERYRGDISWQRPSTKAALPAGFADSVRAQGIVLEAKGLAFSYSSRPLISALDLRVGRGERLVIQGESGTGKSTLLSLLLGVLQPGGGDVLVNGFPVQMVREALSSELGYVGPEPFLVEGSVRENLLYGHPQAGAVTDAEIWRALEKAQLLGAIRELPRQLEEHLYELTQLSTGQKQRLAIARALLRSPKLLILDEASANLDPSTEQSFIDSLVPLFADLTVVVISHKDSYNRIATQLLKMSRLV